MAQAWFTEQEEILESIDLLREIQKLSLNPLAHSAEREGRDEKARPVTFFRTDRDENNNLRKVILNAILDDCGACLLYTSPSPRDRTRSRMPSSA